METSRLRCQRFHTPICREQYQFDREHWTVALFPQEECIVNLTNITHQWLMMDQFPERTNQRYAQFRTSTIPFLARPN